MSVLIAAKLCILELHRGGLVQDRPGPGSRVVINTQEVQGYAAKTCFEVRQEMVSKSVCVCVCVCVFERRGGGG